MIFALWSCAQSLSIPRIYIQELKFSVTFKILDILYTPCLSCYHSSHLYHNIQVWVLCFIPFAIGGWLVWACLLYIQSGWAILWSVYLYSGAERCALDGNAKNGMCKPEWWSALLLSGLSRPIPNTTRSRWRLWDIITLEQGAVSSSTDKQIYRRKPVVNYYTLTDP